MALYKITHGDETRLVEANSIASALRHVATPMFTVTAVTDAVEAAKLAGSGVKVETARRSLSDRPEGTIGVRQ